ncbi:MAG: precorrin-6y C5,15-methyltransferase (decarboxylating) subunit CbiE [Bacillota bacterium]
MEPRHRIAVVGIGPGPREWLAPAAEEAIRSADLLVGGRRHLEEYAGNKPAVLLDRDLDRAFRDMERARRVAVLASGDPGLYGILGRLREYFGPGSLQVFPGISAFQMAFARACLPWHSALLLSLHGREHRLGEYLDAVEDALEARHPVAVLTGQGLGPQVLARALLKRGFSSHRFLVGENLGYPEERVMEGTVRELSSVAQPWEPAVVVVIP